jgi:hypothetical protein
LCVKGLRYVIGGKIEYVVLPMDLQFVFVDQMEQKQPDLKYEELLEKEETLEVFHLFEVHQLHPQFVLQTL